LLPIYINGNATPGDNQEFKAAPADRGRDHPAARLAEQADANQKAWEQMPAITLPEVINDTKPGATVILEARSTKDRNRVAPLLVEERYGRGRTMALMAEDTWRWRMMLEFSNKSFETFWRNLMRRDGHSRLPMLDDTHCAGFSPDFFGVAQSLEQTSRVRVRL